MPVPEPRHVPDHAHHRHRPRVHVGLRPQFRRRHARAPQLSGQEVAWRFLDELCVDFAQDFMRPFLA
eukprot:263060-Rhodomonas_salina.5